MTQSNEPGQLMDIGTVAAHNIAQALGLAEKDVETVRNAIRDEISAMSSHFTMAVADVQTHFEIEKAQLKSEYDKAVASVRADYSFVSEHWGLVAGALAVASLIGWAIGHFV